MFQLNNKKNTIDSIWDLILTEKSIIVNFWRKEPHEKKNSALFPGPFVVQFIASTVVSIYVKIF